MVNTLAHAAPSRGQPSSLLIKTFYAQETAEAAHQQWKHVADALRQKFSRFADIMDAPHEDVLTYSTFPKEHWSKTSSTNPLKRANIEIKRGTDVIGIFPSDAAIIRLVGALMLEQNDEWPVSRHHMTPKTLGGVSHNPVVSLPAMTVRPRADLSKGRSTNYTTKVPDEGRHHMARPDRASMGPCKEQIQRYDAHESVAHPEAPTPFPDVQSVLAIT